VFYSNRYTYRICIHLFPSVFFWCRETYLHFHGVCSGQRLAGTMRRAANVGGGRGSGTLANATGTWSRAGRDSSPVAKGTDRLTPCRPTGPSRSIELYQDTSRVASGLGAAYFLPHRRVPSSLAFYLSSVVLEGQEPQRVPEFWRALLLIR